MVKVLIVGLSEEIGGIENLFFNLFKEGANNCKIDFLAFGKKCAYESEFIKLGYKVYHMPTRKESLFQFNSYVKDFFSLHNDYDYIWFNTASTSMYQFQLYGKKLTNAKVITHSHGTSIDRNNGNFLYFVNKALEIINRKKVTNNTDVFLCCSYAAGEALFGKKYKNRLQLVKNGIYVSKYKYSKINSNALKTEMKIDDSTVIVSMIGRLSTQKNPIKGLEIFHEYHQLNKNSILFVIGDGDLKKEMINKISELGIEKSVRMLGFRNDIGALMSCSDILLMPSLFEGLPLTAIEAECNGMCCFLSNTITNEAKLIDECYFVPLDASSKDWAKAIMDMYSPVTNREDYYKQIFEAGYSIEETRKEVMKLLQGEK